MCWSSTSTSHWSHSLSNWTWPSFGGSQSRWAAEPLHFSWCWSHLPLAAPCLGSSRPVEPVHYVPAAAMNRGAGLFSWALAEAMKAEAEWSGKHPILLPKIVEHHTKWSRHTLKARRNVSFLAFDFWTLSSFLNYTVGKTDFNKQYQ
jgi:hypothetical protein